jgi:sec-independent protein translocase protein TatB
VFNLGMGEITVILLLAIIFLGPKKLPDLASGLGKIIRDIRKATSDVKNEIALDDTFRKPFEELRDAVTLHPDELKRRDELKRSLEDIRKRAEALENEGREVGNETTPPPPEGEGTGETPSPAVTPEAGAALAAVDGPDPATEASPFVPPPPPAAPLFTPPAAPAAPLAGATAARLRLTPSGGISSLARKTPTTPPAGGPTVPTAPPSGTVSAPPTRFGPPRVTPPVSSLSSDKSNTTQSLSEEDLLPPAAPPALPGRKTSPPPLPGVVKPPPAPPDSKKT